MIMYIHKIYIYYYYELCHFSSKGIVKYLRPSNVHYNTWNLFYSLTYTTITTYLLMYFTTLKVYTMFKILIILWLNQILSVLEPEIPNNDFVFYCRSHYNCILKNITFKNRRATYKKVNTITLSCMLRVISSHVEIIQNNKIIHYQLLKNDNHTIYAPKLLE